MSDHDRWSYANADPDEDPCPIHPRRPLTDAETRDYWDTDHNRWSYIDRWADDALDDVGSPGHSIVESVNADGSRSYWIIREQTVGDPSDGGPWTMPDHEHPRPLPPEWVARIRSAQIRCAAPRKDGHPCRTPVAAPGTRCTWHQPKDTRR